MYYTKTLLSVNKDAKTVKGLVEGYETGIMYLAPHKEVKGVNLCPNASEGCIKACLFTAGRGVYENIKEARKNKTKYFLNDRELFLSQLNFEISKNKILANKKGYKFAVRLNGTSDLPWEEIKINGKTLMELHEDVQFYDYTKNHKRFKKDLPKNYHLTFSMDEREGSKIKAKMLLDMGFNVAIVFNKLPKTYMGYKVVNGDENDLTFLNDGGTILGLKAKGRAKKDESGFVIKLK